MRIEKASVPINPGVEAITEVLGLDPLFMANEGKLIAICAAEDADILIKAMRNHEKGKNACVIGEVTKSKGNMVELITEFGGKRLLEWKYADPLPRIC
jgi:hydrogenase expression/formation protein HypE